MKFPADIPIYRAVGCRACRNTGYHGRRAIFEWMDTNNEVRRLILRSASSDQIRDAAKRAGLRLLSEDGWRLVREGVTTPEEVLRVTKDQTLGEQDDSEAAEIVAGGDVPVMESE